MIGAHVYTPFEWSPQDLLKDNEENCPPAQKPENILPTPSKEKEPLGASTAGLHMTLPPVVWYQTPDAGLGEVLNEI